MDFWMISMILCPKYQLRHLSLTFSHLCQPKHDQPTDEKDCGSQYQLVRFQQPISRKEKAYLHYTSI